MQKPKIKVKCNHCGYEWEARVKAPKACPMCKQYLKRTEQEAQNEYYK